MYNTRRSVLAAAGTGLTSAVAGCSADSGDNNTQPESEQDESESRAPQIQEVALISEWKDFGDVIDKQITSIEAGEDANLGVRYRYYHTNGTHHVYWQLEIYGPDGSQVDVFTDSAERLTSDEGWAEWERYQNVWTDGLETGEYRAVWQIRDEISGETSERIHADFSIT